MMNEKGPGTSPVVSPVHPMMTIGECINALLQGRLVRRTEWEDPEVYLIIVDEKVMIYKPETRKLHPLIFSTGDLTATDWIMTERREPDEEN